MYKHVTGVIYAFGDLLVCGKKEQDSFTLSTTNNTHLLDDSHISKCVSCDCGHNKHKYNRKNMKRRERKKERKSIAEERTRKQKKSSRRNHKNC